MITQTYTLDLIPHGEPLIVHASQYDTESRTLVFNLVKEGVAFDATGMSASIRGTKPDNTGFMYAMTVSGTSVSIDIKDQMTALAGNVPCEVLIADANGSLGTANFTLRVEKSALDDETVISETDIPVFEELVTQASNYASQASSSASAAAAAMNDVAYQASSSTALSSATQATLYSDQAKTAPIAPNTSTEAVWDAEGNRLDNVLSDIQSDVSDIQGDVSTAETNITNLQTAVSGIAPVSAVPTMTAGTNVTTHDIEYRYSEQTHIAMLRVRFSVSAVLANDSLIMTVAGIKTPTSFVITPTSAVGENAAVIMDTNRNIKAYGQMPVVNWACAYFVYTF